MPAKISAEARWIFLLIFVLLFMVDLLLVVTGRTQAFDEAALGAFFELRGDFLTFVFRVFAFSGDPYTMIGFCIVIIILPGRMKVGLPVAIMTGIGFLVQTLFKTLVARPRPDAANWLVDETGYSFPSGHSCACMIFWAALLIIVGRILILKDNRTAAASLRAVFFLIAVCIGLSRLYLGVHYPSDVFGGWMLAGIILTVCFAAYDKIWPYKWRVTYDVPDLDTILKNTATLMHKKG